MRGLHGDPACPSGRPLQGTARQSFRARGHRAGSRLGRGLPSTVPTHDRVPEKRRGGPPPPARVPLQSLSPQTPHRDPTSGPALCPSPPPGWEGLEGRGHIHPCTPGWRWATQGDQPMQPCAVNECPGPEQPAGGWTDPQTRLGDTQGPAPFWARCRCSWPPIKPSLAATPEGDTEDAPPLWGWGGV